MTEHVDLFGNPDEEAIYQAALAVPLDEKIRKAIVLIREYEPMALQLSDDGYYVAFSGGKDSIVMERLFKMAGVKYVAWYNNVTIDPPELVRFIKREYPEVEWNSIGKHLCTMLGERSSGPPSRLVRWCCEIYKEQGGNGALKAIGVRAEESPRRKGLWTTIRTDTRTKLPVICPILHWTHSDIWQFIHLNNMPYCELYDQGFTRLGCVGCPMGTRANRIKEFERWPKYERLWRRGIDSFFDKFKGVPRRNGEPRAIEKYANSQELWDWWMEEDNVNDTDQPDCQMWLW